MANRSHPRAIILHGMPGEDEYFDDIYPSGSNSHWPPWLQKQLLMRGCDTQTPEIADAYRPQYALWQTEFERHLTDEPMVLIGHSCGAGFLVRWLSEHPDVAVETLALVAPWLDPQRKDTTDFFDFVIDDSLPSRVRNFHLFHSQDDMASIQESVAILLEHYPTATMHEYEDMGHFCFEDMQTVEFPDLLSAVIK